jgi:hypothetical protein
LIAPERRGQEVVVHYSTVALSTQVTRNTAERLSAELGGILCFEMEAADLMIRGVCDYADVHKKEGWQPYAAAATAACAKEKYSVFWVPALIVESFE